MRGWTRRDLLSAVAGTGVGLGVATRSGATGSAGAARAEGAAVDATQPASEWPSFGHDRRNSGHHPTAAGPREAVGPAWTLDARAALEGTPAVVDGTVYTGAASVVAVDAASGERRWAFTEGRSGYESPAVTDDAVYVNNEFGTVFALDRTDGSERWRTEVGQNSYGGVTVADGTVYVGSSDRSLYALDAADGSELWAVDTGSPYVATPAVLEGLVFAASNALVAIDRADGSVRWSVETGLASAPAVGAEAGAVFLGGSETLYAVDFDGTTRWTVGGADRFWGSPAILDGTVYATSQEGTVHAVDATSGEHEWRATPGGELYASPSVADGLVHVAGGGTMYALRADDGAVVWSFDAGPELGRSCSVVGGRLYVGDANGTLYALAEVPTPTPTPTETATPDGGGTGGGGDSSTPSPSPTPAGGAGGGSNADGDAGDAGGAEESLGGPDGGVAALPRSIDDPLVPVGGATVLGVLGSAALWRRLRGAGDTTEDGPAAGEADDGATLAPGPDGDGDQSPVEAGGSPGDGAGRPPSASAEWAERASDDGSPTADEPAADQQRSTGEPEPVDAMGATEEPSGSEATTTGDPGDADTTAGATDTAAGATDTTTQSADGSPQSGDVSSGGRSGDVSSGGGPGGSGGDGPRVERGPGPGPPGLVPGAPEAALSYEDLDIGDRIGTGGSADVHRATATVVGETVTLAVKRPRFEGTLGREVIERHRSEAETWAKLDAHDNVVGLVDHGTRPVPWLAMEYMDAGDLTERVDGPSYVERLWIGHRVCEGVYHAHRHGVSHLDLKPGNVLFRSVEGGWDVPKVGDWGLSKQLLDDSVAGEGLSPSYAAPEQFDDSLGPTNHVTDVYQLGAVLYELFTGRPPFEGPPNRVMNAVLTDEPAPPTAVNPDLPARLDDALLPALERDRSDRYDSVIYLRDELESIARAVR